MSARAQSQRPGYLTSWVLPVAIAAFGVAVLVTYMSGRVSADLAILAILGPAAAIGALLRPALPVIVLVAVPPGALTLAGITTTHVTLLALALLALVAVTRGTIHIGARSGILPLAALIVLAELHQAPGVINPPAADLLRSLILFTCLTLAAYNLTRANLISLVQVETALIVGAAATALALIALAGFNPVTLVARYLSAPDDSAFTHFQLHFGMLVVMGFTTAIGRTLLIPHEGRWRTKTRARDIALIVFLLAMLTLSFTRAAWLAAGLTILYLALRLRRSRYIIAVLVAGTALLLAPITQQRLTGDIEQGVAEAAESGELGTGRLGLWRDLVARAETALPWGHGFGHMWSLSPQELFGSEGEFTAGGNPFVYAHNDFIFLLLELGLPGVILLTAFWAHLFRAWRRGIRFGTPQQQRALVTFTGVLITMMVGHLVSNSLFFEGVSTRFFLVAGIIFGVAAGAHPHTRAGAGATSQRAPEVSRSPEGAAQQLPHARTPAART